MNKHTILMFILVFLGIQNIQAQSLGYNNHRFAISADGNTQADNKHKWPRADPDDWGATPATLAMIAKLELQDQLVHFSYNNFIDAPAHTTETNQMKLGVDGALKYWDFDETRFFDASEGAEKAISHLAIEIGKSTKDDPLYFIHMGPAEFFYRAVKQVVDEGKSESLSHVIVISHSGYNDNHLRRGDPKYDKEPVAAEDKHHTMTETIELSGNRIQYKKIKDQNAGEQPTVLWKSHEDWSVWYWMRDHKDPSIRFIYERMLVNSKNSADISDAGMVYYLLVGDENGSPSKFKTFIGKGILEVPEEPVIECSDFTLVGIKDFEVAQIDTFVTAYKDNGRNAIAVNAGAYKNKFAATQKTFEGVSSYYNVDLTTLTEEDGESTYRFSVNGELVGEFQNPKAGEDGDMKPHVHTFENVLIRNGDLLQIESNTHSNGLIPEGDAFAFSRGRWRSLEFQCLKGSDCSVEDKDGMIVFEAERFELKGSWKLGEDDRASGGKYIYYDGPNSYTNVNESNIISYTFHVNNPGSYTVKWTMRQPEGERGSDKGNDVYIYLSDDIGWAKEHALTEYEKFYSRSGDDFVLHGIAEIHGEGHSWLNAKFPKAGDYTINICGRSHGLQIDRIVMFKGITFENCEQKITEFAETTSCSGSLTPKENKLGISSVPVVIPNNKTSIEPKVGYTALESATVVCSLLTPDGTVVATKEKNVNEGTGVETFALNWENDLTIAKGYKVSVEMYLQGGDKTEKLVQAEQNLEVIDKNSAADKDVVSYLEVPTTLPQDKKSFEVKVKYSATQDRDVNIELKDAVYITNAMQKVMAGYGETTITINIPKTLNVDESYNLILAIRPSGGNWETNIMKSEVKIKITEPANVEPEVNELTISSLPETISNEQNSLSATINYTAAKNSTIECILVKPDGTTVATSEKNVNAGTASETLTINWNDELAAAEDYKVKSVMYLQGGDKTEVLVDAEKQIEITAPEIYELAINSLPETVTNDKNSFAATVHYTASANSTIECALLKPDGTTVATVEKNVTEGTGAETLTINWTEELTVAKGYKVKAIMYLQGGDKTEVLIGAEKQIEITAPEVYELTISSLPETITDDQKSISATLNYTASANSTIECALIKPDGTSVATAGKDVNEGTGAETLTITWTEELTAAKGYKVKAIMYLQGGNKSDMLVEAESEFEITNAPNGITNQENSVKILPNPFTESFQFENDGQIKDFSIVAMTGQTIMQKRAKKGLNTVNMVSELKGMYILKLDYKDTSNTCTKIIKK